MSTARRTRALVLVSSLLCGCRGAATPAPPGASPPGSASPGQKPPQVEVVADAALITAARARVAAEEAKQLDRFFAAFAEAGGEDAQVQRRFAGRNEPVARLAAIRDDAKAQPAARARAAALLCGIGERSCWDGIDRLLSAEPPVARMALLHFRDLAGTAGRPPAPILTRIAALVRSPSPEVRSAAASVCEAIGIPEAAPHLLAVLRGDISGPKGDAALALANDAPSVEVVRLAAGLIGKNPDEDTWLKMALNTMAGLGDPAVAAAAIAALKAYAARPGASDDDRSWAVHAMARSGSAAEIPALRQAADSGPANDQAVALAGLVRLGDPGALEKLGRKRVDLGADAVSALRMAASRTSDAATVAKLIEWLPKEAADDRAHVAWLARGLTPAAAGARVAELGVIPSRPAPGLEDISRREGGQMDLPGLWVLADMLERSGAVLHFDTETGEVPVHHDLLLRDLAGISRGTFAPEAVWEEFKNRKNDDDFDAPYLVQFVHRDRLYRVTAENLGDWYDMTSVLALANRALGDAGAAERFITLFTGDQMTRVVFANPAAAQRAAAEYLLVLEDDPDRGRQDGKAFEAQAIEDLKKRGAVIVK